LSRSSASKVVKVLATRSKVRGVGEVFKQSIDQLFPSGDDPHIHFTTFFFTFLLNLMFRRLIPVIRPHVEPSISQTPRNAGLKSFNILVSSPDQQRQMAPARPMASLFSSS